MTVKNDLEEILDLVKDGFVSLGLADRVDGTARLIGAGEYEIAYTSLCDNIQEFEVPISQQAYDLLVKVWPSLREGIHRLEGADWHFVDYLGDRGGLPDESKKVRTEQPVEHPETRGARVFPWNAEPTGVKAPGSLELHQSWTLSVLTRARFERLVRLGVHIFPSQRGDAYTFEVPHGLFPEQEAVVQQLLKAIARSAHSEVTHVDWYPHGNKYRIYLT